ncbi:hypothetical protein HYH03_015950 [Edaphochlamys debaryana]|uniref:Transglutaminase-like domain-containing protein n=1 Tax=Edaphochlamys debaryana TaxID=47281 RepID=A0A836BQL8_9CHLO|nr:hypothetical protein HYH03_015950 [Edaphochlamys debaryana]|eukprot:KAG2485275.1 hypothetical protein HYH03_015950 [Edaphochlamys debaryana]
MPEADQKSLPGKQRDFLATHCKLAIQARGATAYAQGVPTDLFENNVIPYASLDEPREDWRTFFRGKLAPLVEDAATTLDAARTLNALIWTLEGWNVTICAEPTPDLLSPSQVLSRGCGTASSLAVFLVDACRAVGVPARVAGVAAWKLSNGTRGYHHWVEVWHAGAWSFTDPLPCTGMDAAEGATRPFNETWFFPDPVRSSKPGSLGRGVWASSYKYTGKVFPLPWRDDYSSNVPGIDVTKHYLEDDQQVAQETVAP